MNVTGVGAGPPLPPPPVPAAGPAPAAAPAERPPNPATTTSEAAAQDKADRKHERDVEKLPPLRGLSLTEIRVMLGQLPAGAAAKLGETSRPGSFDTYA